MPAPNLLVHCPHCAAYFDLMQGWEDEDARKFVDLLTQLPPSAVRPCFRYLTACFKPKAQALRWSTLLKLAKELVPMIKAAQVKRNGTLYSVPLPVWITAMHSLATAAPANVQMPFKNHAYLLTILANQAEQVAAKEETKTEQRRQAGERVRDAVEAITLAELTELANKIQAERAAEPPTNPPPETKKRTVNAIPKDIKDVLGMGLKTPLTEAELAARREQIINDGLALLAQQPGELT